MKRSDFDSQLQTFNHVGLSEKESKESYQRIISKVNSAKKRKNVKGAFNRTITAFATIIVFVAAGWFLHDVLQPSLNQPGDHTPSVVDDGDKEEKEQIIPETREDESEISENDDETEYIERIDTCVDSDVEPNSDSMLVYFECQEFEEHPHPVKAVIRDAGSEMVEKRIEYAIQELLKGPTKEEKEKGFGSIFNEETAGLLNSIELQDSGHLIVDFIDFSRIIPNGSASAASISMMDSLNTTVSQFKEVKTIEYQFNGSCNDFFGWIQSTCMSYSADDYRTNDDGVRDDKRIPHPELLERSELLLDHLLNKEWEEFASHLHIKHGLVYSPFSNVGDNDDLHFSKEEVKGFGEDETLYSWSWDQSGAHFMATPNEFVENLLKTNNDYVYDYDEITYNESKAGTMLNLIHDEYPDSIYVELLDEPDEDSMDWYKYQALRFVYEKMDQEWYLVALVRGAYNP